MEVTIVPLGRLTGTGTALLVVVPLPSCPDELLPHARTEPVDVRARPKPPPAARAVTIVPLGRLTGTGTALLVPVPLPTTPDAMSRKASTAPVVVTDRPPPTDCT